MLIAKGYTVSFKVGGRWVKARTGYALLHDPSGKAFPKCSGLVAPIQKRSRHEVDDGEARSYFGQNGLEGSLTMPPRGLYNWSRVGPVEEIRYTRNCPTRSCSNPGQYFHVFEKSPTLYKLGRMFRLELHSGCEWNWRGIVTP